MINLDSEDPAGLASFYSAVLGWNVLHSEADYAMIGDGSINIGFGKVPGYSTRPSGMRWPSAPPSRPSSPTPQAGGYCWIRAVIRSTSA